jgi:1-acyl-sn-glycerol-3-phosphate acyltransferase
MWIGKKVVRLIRAVLTALFFFFFAVGGAAFSAFVFPFLRSRRSGHRVVCGLWRFLVSAFLRSGLIAVSAEGLNDIRGRIIVANHPSLIDVVVLTALAPDVYSVAKNQLRGNIFIGPIVRAVMLSNDERILEDAREIIDSGGNVLIFPEGTRTPLQGGYGKLHRGAAQLSIRLGVPVTPVRIEVSRRILAKGQSIFDMGEKTVEFRLTRSDDIVPPPVSERGNRSGAIALTSAIEKALLKTAEDR